jgi:hypothetical protein
MNPVTSLAVIVSLLLALAVGDNSIKGQATVSSPSAARNTSSRPLPGWCEEWGCGMNHNETLMRDAARIK